MTDERIYDWNNQEQQFRNSSTGYFQQQPPQTLGLVANPRSLRVVPEAYNSSSAPGNTARSGHPGAPKQPFESPRLARVRTADITRQFYQDQGGEQLGSNRSLESSFQRVSPKNVRSYFKKGKVFRALWTQTADHENEGKRHTRAITVSGTEFQEPIHTKVQWFIVVRSYKSHCLCVPVATYGLQGTKKHGVNPDDHAALVLDGSDQVLLDGERLRRAPLHIKMDDRAVRSLNLLLSSRINFTKVHTIEYNIKVQTIGRIIHQDLPKLDQYFTESVLKISEAQDTDRDDGGQALVHPDIISDDGER